MASVTTDASALVSGAGGYVLFATDRSDYIFRGLPQIVWFAFASSATTSPLPALRSAGFAVTPIGGGSEYSHGFSTNAPLQYWQARSS